MNTLPPPQPISSFPLVLYCTGEIATDGTPVKRLGRLVYSERSADGWPDNVIVDERTRSVAIRIRQDEFEAVPARTDDKGVAIA